MSILTDARFRDDTAAREYLESVVWPTGPFCPHCGALDRIYSMKGGRAGLKKCGHCRKQFTVTVGTVFESSHVPLHKWMQAAYLLTSSKKGISSHQLHRTLQVQYRTAWFMSHRLREAMKAGKLPPMGGEGKSVESDETFLWNKEGIKKPRTGGSDKRAVLALVERGAKVRMFHIEKANAKTIRPIVEANVARQSMLHTDEASLYTTIGRQFAGHETVNHSEKEYARGDVTTNTAEGVFSIFKRGMQGIYQHCAEHHLHRYVTEFEFRYNNRSRLGIEDAERADNALRGIVGKRLTYRQPD